MSQFDAAKAAQRTVVLIAGNDDQMRHFALQSLMKAAGITEDDMDVETIIADSRAVGEWLGAAGSMPFFGDRRVVIVRNIGRVDPEAAPKGSKMHPLALEMSSLPPSTLLVLVGDLEMGEAGMRSAPRRIEAWTKIVAQAGGAHFSFEPDRKRASEAVFAAAQERGFAISRRAAGRLGEMTAGSVGSAIAELEKLSLYALGREIKESDVEKLVTPEGDYDIFRLVETITLGDAAGAMKQLKLLTDRHPNLQGEIFPRVFPMLSRQVRLLYQARIVIDDRTDPTNPGPETLAKLPSTPNFMSEKDWLRGKLLTSARRLSLSQLAKCLQELEMADARMKGQESGFSPRETLEVMALRMATICSNSR